MLIQEMVEPISLEGLSRAAFTYLGQEWNIAESYLKKGSKVYIEGKLITQAWKDKDGNKKYKTMVNGFLMQMLGGGDRKERENNNQQSMPKGIEDDLPF